MALYNFVKVYYESMKIHDNYLYPGYSMKMVEDEIEAGTKEQREAMKILAKNHDKHYRLTMIEKEKSEDEICSFDTPRGE